MTNSAAGAEPKTLLLAFAAFAVIWFIVVLVAVRNGSIRMWRRTFRRTDRPVAFWIAISWSALLGSLAFAVPIWMIVRRMLGAP